MPVDALDGWTAKDLNGLKEDIAEIKATLKKMESHETQSLRDRVNELENRPRLQMQAVIVPFLCACIPATVVILSHA